MEKISIVESGTKNCPPIFLLFVRVFCTGLLNFYTRVHIGKFLNVEKKLITEHITDKDTFRFHAKKFSFAFFATSTSVDIQTAIAFLSLPVSNNKDIVLVAAIKQYYGQAIFVVQCIYS